MFLTHVCDVTTTSFYRDLGDFYKGKKIIIIERGLNILLSIFVKQVGSFSKHFLHQAYFYYSHNYLLINYNVSLQTGLFTFSFPPTIFNIGHFRMVTRGRPLPNMDLLLVCFFCNA